MCCQYCGAKISDNAVFCKECGKKQQSHDNAGDNQSFSTPYSRTPEQLQNLMKKARRTRIVDIILAVTVGGYGVISLLACLIAPEDGDTTIIVIGIFCVIAALTRVFGAVRAKTDYMTFEKEYNQAKR